MQSIGRLLLSLIPIGECTDLVHILVYVYVHMPTLITDRIQCKYNKQPTFGVQIFWLVYVCVNDCPIIWFTA